MQKPYYTTQPEVLAAALRGESFFLTGSAGTGKSFIIQKIRKSISRVVVTASTGIAARNIGGKTIHRWSGIGAPRALEDPKLSPEAATRQAVRDATNRPFYDERADEIAEARTLIIDEVSMLSAPFLNAIDQICQDARANDKPFGGLQVILVGDPFQLPPVSRNSKAIPCFEADIFRSPHFKKANLEQIFRQKDPVFIAALNQIRLGRVTEPINRLFLERQAAKATRDIRPVYLFPTNDGADQYNRLLLDKEPGDLKKAEMRGYGEETYQDNLRKLILPPKTLHLKVNARVMATKNDPEDGYVNGSLGWVKAIKDDEITVQFDDAKAAVAIKRHTWTTLTDEEKSEIERALAAKEKPDYPHGYAEVSQFPLILGYALTIHKSQGLTFDRAFINLTQTFEAGQAYVALSRVKSLDGLFLAGWDPNKIRAPKETLAYMEKMFGAVVPGVPAVEAVPHLPSTPSPTPAASALPDPAVSI